MGYIYKITNNINNKIYVGKTITTIENRFKGHIKKAKAGYKNSYIQNALIKYGVENFCIEELDEADTLEDLNKKEIYWIEKLDARNRNVGYNQAPGGDGGDIFNSLSIEQQEIKIQKHSQDTANRIWINNGSIAKYIKKSEVIPDGFVRGRLPLSEETKKKMSQSHIGRYVSPETVAKIVKTRKERGYVVSDTTREKLRKANLGKKWPDEINKKKGRSRFGTANSMYGTHYKWLTDGRIDIKVYEKDYDKLPYYYEIGYQNGRSNKTLFHNQQDLNIGEHS